MARDFLIGMMNFIHVFRNRLMAGGYASFWGRQKQGFSRDGARVGPAAIGNQSHKEAVEPDLGCCLLDSLAKSVALDLAERSPVS